MFWKMLSGFDAKWKTLSRHSATGSAITRATPCSSSIARASAGIPVSVTTMLIRSSSHTSQKAGWLNFDESASTTTFAADSIIRRLIATTSIAGAFDITRPMPPQVAQVMQTVIEKGYRDFTGRVSEARKKPVADVDAVARGRVWTGAQAKERGLVDAFGGLQTALNDAAKRAKLGDKPGTYHVRYIERELTPFERWFGGFATGAAGRAMLGHSDLARSLLAKAAPQAERDLAMFQRAIEDNGKGPQGRIFAYCFCRF